tara:strand:- start:36 stop:245 length:210 start_codon:yes stop_codon:yes gene_type:complete
MKLPELSVIDTHLPSNTKIRGYTVEQMLAWGKACAAAEREACVKLCDDWPNGRDDVYLIACAIRARGTT